jgi:hypothetical protein
MIKIMRNFITKAVVVALPAFKLLINKNIVRKKIRIKKFNTNYSNIRTFLEGNVRISDLSVYIHGCGNVGISKTPHFQHAMFLVNAKGNSDMYVEYIQKFYPEEDLEDTINNFQATLGYVASNRDESMVLISSRLSELNEYSLVDGCHRASIMLALGETRINAAFCL